jgi:hypothetical protein
MTAHAGSFYVIEPAMGERVCLPYTLAGVTEAISQAQHLSRSAGRQQVTAVRDGRARIIRIYENGAMIMSTGTEPVPIKTPPAPAPGELRVVDLAARRSRHHRTGGHRGLSGPDPYVPCEI